MELNGRHLHHDQEVQVRGGRAPLTKLRLGHSYLRVECASSSTWVPALGDLARIDDQDLVGPADGGQPVRDHQRRPARQRGLKRPLYGRLRLRAADAILPRGLGEDPPRKAGRPTAGGYVRAPVPQRLPARCVHGLD